MTPMPWPLIGCSNAADIPPTPPPWTRGVPNTEWASTRYAWERSESLVLGRLAAAGGDLAAHRAVHLEETHA